MRSGFFENTDVYAEDFAKAFAGVLTNGVLADSEGTLKVSAASGMTLNVAAGYCWIEGHFGASERGESVTISAADGSLPRVDRVVARLNLSAASISVIAIAGTAAESPVAPDVVRDGTYYDLGLATVSIPAGTVEITEDMITDTRNLNDVCGGVTARTGDILVLDGKADVSDVQALDDRVTTAEQNIIAKKITVGALSGGSAAVPSVYRMALVTVSGYIRYETDTTEGNTDGSTFKATVAVALIPGTTYAQTGRSDYLWLTSDLGGYRYLALGTCSYSIVVTDTGVTLQDISCSVNSDFNAFTLTPNVSITHVEGVY